MENINKLTGGYLAVEDQYYESFEDYIDSLDSLDLDDIFDVEFYNCVLRKVVDFSKADLWAKICNHFSENQSEDGDEWEKVEKVFNEFVTEEKVSAFVEKMPSLWWPDGEKVTVPKEEIVAYLKENKYI